MRQAYQHIEPTNTYYSEIKESILKLAKNWNDTHNSKCDPQVIFDDCKRIFKYHKWISIDDIEPAIDLGLMGEFGENKGLNSETIFKWFTGWSKTKNQNELKSHSAYKTESTFISISQRKETRNALIKAFMNFYSEYRKTKQYNPKMDHFIPVFWRWFKKLGLITISEDEENIMIKAESEKLNSMRVFFSEKQTKSTKTQKKMFIEMFDMVCGQDIDIELKLNSLSL